MDAQELRIQYDAMKTEATRLAGDLLDIPRRVVILCDLYADSKGNHTFSQIAAHGALWASSYFEVGGSLGRLIANRYFYNAKEKAFRLGILDDFATAFRRINRQVCIDTYTNYYFTKQFGREASAREILPESLLTALNTVHTACREGTALSPAEKRTVFEQSFHCEQEITVAPGVTAAVSAFECRIMKFLVLHPVVRFAFFPFGRYLFFRNFADVTDRIKNGMRAYDRAAQAGWDHVQLSLKNYGVMPPEFFASPAACMAQIRASVNEQSQSRPAAV